MLVTYGKKRHDLWIKIPKLFGNTAPTKIQRDMFGNTYFYISCYDLYCNFLHLCFLLNYFILHNSVHFLDVFLSNYFSLSFIYFWYILDKVKDFRRFWACYGVDTLVKGADNFWKVCGIIYKLNKLRR